MDAWAFSLQLTAVLTASSDEKCLFSNIISLIYSLRISCMHTVYFDNDQKGEYLNFSHPQGKQAAHISLFTIAKIKEVKCQTTKNWGHNSSVI